MIGGLVIASISNESEDPILATSHHPSPPDPPLLEAALVAERVGAASPAQLLLGPIEGVRPIIPTNQLASSSGRPSETVAVPQDTRRPSFMRRGLRRVALWMKALFELFSLVTILAIMTAIPFVQLISFGYLLDVSGRLTAGQKVKDALRWRSAAGQIGLAFAAILLWSLPIRLLTHWGTAAEIVSPGIAQADWLRLGALSLAVLAMLHLSWAWARGGRLNHYLWPAPLEWLKRAWRPSTWMGLADSLWLMARSFECPRLFWLGLRGAIGTLIWLLPATVIIAVNRNGQTGAAGLVGALAFLCLGVALMYLPMLQANFAEKNRLRAMFAVKTIRQDFRHAPWAWLTAMFLTLVLLPIPLYLLKIEPPPPELIWLPTWFFIAFMLPARIASGLAMRRARSKPEPKGTWAKLSRWVVRFLIPPVVGVYLLFVYLSQYVTWNGLQTWVQQHAVLVPIPFVVD